jgi:magnesium chelatase family protein
VCSSDLVNLAPADLKKSGTAFDLPIAVGILAAYNHIDRERLAGKIFCGELSLDGKVKPIAGTLSIALAASRTGFKELFIPSCNAVEASFVEDIEIFAVTHFTDLMRHLKQEIILERYAKSDFCAVLRETTVDFSEIRGQYYAKRGLEVAAAGGHNLLMIGPPGSGKTMLARRLPTILSPLDKKEALETTKVYSAAGLLQNTMLMTQRPFRAPHHTISYAGLVGGGSDPRPGEISLAHNGVLFLDELPEFRRDALEALRQPLEDKKITISRVQSVFTYPSRFMFVAAMNPCPCGYLTHPRKPCRCSPFQIQRYLNKISGPLLDRVDVHLDVPFLSYEELSLRRETEGSAAIRTRVAAARALQKQRYERIGITSNSELSPKHLEAFCAITEEAKSLLKRAILELGFSARAYAKTLKVARTIADLGQRRDDRPRRDSRSNRV